MDTTALTLDHNVTYYLSGPMSGYPDFNFSLFAAAERWVARQGLKVWSPHNVDHDEKGKGVEHGGLPFSDYLADDIQLGLEAGCRGIILLPGWPQSRGARLELTLALGLDWPVLYLEDLGYGRWLLVDMNRTRPNA